jgi:hypothetical protein
MSNTTQEKIDMNRTIIEGVKALITNRIHDCVSYIGLGEPTATTSLDLIPSHSVDKSKLVEIYNLSKALEVIDSNHKAMVRELNERDED